MTGQPGWTRLANFSRMSPCWISALPKGHGRLRNRSPHERRLPGLERTTLVALTGYGRTEDRERSEAAGFTAHLVKPVDPNELRALLSRLPRAIAEKSCRVGRGFARPTVGARRCWWASQSLDPPYKTSLLPLASFPFASANRDAYPDRTSLLRISRHASHHHRYRTLRCPSRSWPAAEAGPTRDQGCPRRRLIDETLPKATVLLRDGLISDVIEGNAKIPPDAIVIDGTGPHGLRGVHRRRQPTRVRCGPAPPGRRPARAGGPGQRHSRRDQARQPQGTHAGVRSALGTQGG